MDGADGVVEVDGLKVPKDSMGVDDDEDVGGGLDLTKPEKLF